MPLQGDLAILQLAEVIRLVGWSRRSGLLYVAAPDEARVLEIREGHFVAATSLERRFRLGLALVERGHLQPLALEGALAAQRASPERSLGDILLEQNAVKMEGLRATIRDQVRDAIDDALRWKEGGFRFEEADARVAPNTGRDASIAFETEPLLLDALQKLDEWLRISKPFEDRNAIVEFGGEEGKEPASLPVGDEDPLKVLELVDGRKTIAQICRKLPWPDYRVIRTLSKLLDASFIRLKPSSDTGRAAPLSFDQGLNLAVSPRAAARAIALASVEKAGVETLHAAALSDPGLALSVLRAGSAHGRIEGAPFATVRDAIGAIGEEITRQALIAAGLRGIFVGARFYNHDLWRHSIVTGIAAGRLAGALGMPAERAAEAHLCGLLHDIGAILLRSRLGAAYEKVDHLVAQGVSRPEAEKKLIGVTHDRVGSRALEHCAASTACVEAALLHHAPIKTEPWQVAIVQVADAIARRVGYDAEALAAGDPKIEDIAVRGLAMPPELSRRVVQEVTDEAAARDPLW